MAQTKKSDEKSEKYTGKQLLKSAKGIEHDIISVILEPQKSYTLGEVKKLKENYLNKEVK